MYHTKSAPVKSAFTFERGFTSPNSLKYRKADLRAQDPVPFDRWRKGSGKMRVRPPYGYCYFQGEVVPDQREYPVLQLIDALMKSGESISSIQRELNDKKMFSRSGKPWTYNVIKSIIYRLSKGSLNSFDSIAKSQKSKQSKKRGQNELR